MNKQNNFRLVLHNEHKQQQILAKEEIKTCFLKNQHIFKKNL